MGNLPQTTSLKYGNPTFNYQPLISETYLKWPASCRHVGTAGDEDVPGVDGGPGCVVLELVVGRDEDERVDALGVALHVQNCLIQIA